MTPGHAAFDEHQRRFDSGFADDWDDNLADSEREDWEAIAQRAVTAAGAAQPARQIGPCPDCGSPQPSMHPAAGDGGEVARLCPNSFHAADPVPETVARLFGSAAAQPAPAMFATEALVRFADDGQWLTCTDDGRLDMRAELLAVKRAIREVFDAAARPKAAQPASGTSWTDPLPDPWGPPPFAPLTPAEEHDRLRDGITQLLAQVTRSAGATRPSKKTQLEDEFAAMLRQLLEEDK